MRTNNETINQTLNQGKTKQNQIHYIERTHTRQETTQHNKITNTKSIEHATKQESTHLIKITRNKTRDHTLNQDNTQQN